MPDRVVLALLNVDRNADRFAQVAVDWVDGLYQALRPEIRFEFAERPARFVAAGPPGERFAQLELWRTSERGRSQSLVRTGSGAGLAWLRREVADKPFDRVWLWLGERDDSGHLSGDLLSVEAQRIRRDGAEWLTLVCSVRYPLFVDWPGGQRAWLDAIWRFADRLDPAYGQIGYSYQYRTALEECLYLHPVQDCDPRHTVAKARSVLRGYDWLTIVAGELAGRLGGAAALAHAGAFAQVRELSGGGLWLLATDDFRDYDEAAVGRVFQAVAPVLPRLPPAQPPAYTGVSYYPVVMADPGGGPGRVSVDWFWRRVPPAEVAHADAQRLAELVPYWFDEEYEDLLEAGRLVGVERSGDLVRRLLLLATRDGTGPQLGGTSLVGEGLDDSCPVGVIPPEQVQANAAALAGADPPGWVRRYRDALLTYAERGGLFVDDDDLAQVARGAHQLIDLFARAADAGEAVVVRVFA